MDVFSTEPLDENSPLLKNDKIITTPHLGASTTEAQEGVALTVAEQMRDFLTSGELRNAVNAPSLAASELEAFQPFIDLAEKLGRFQAQIMNESPICEVKLEYLGELADKDAAPVTRAFLAGLLKDVSARVNVVNAMHIAEERGIRITTSYTQTKRTNADIRTIVSIFKHRTNRLRNGFRKRRRSHHRNRQFLNRSRPVRLYASHQKPRRARRHRQNRHTF